MSISAVLGGQWGDEGKGKIIDSLCENSEVVARFQGGANAGHTILVGQEETILHQLPSGIIRENVDCILGTGMVIDPVSLIHEIDNLKKHGIRTDGRIHISLLAHVVTPIHKTLDASREASLGSKAIGTTKRGIGPCYSDKISRSGVRIKDLKNLSLLKIKLEEKLNKTISKGFIPESDRKYLLKEFDDFYKASENISPFIEDTSSLIHQYISEEKNILIEGAQGTLLDIDYGSYPYVTSSNTVAGNVCTGLGIGPKTIDNIIGVFKAYTTRVGAGPFPTELNSHEGDYLQRRGNEFGATTHRKRRCGWFDAALGKYAVKINGFNSIAITKLDVLDDLEEIKICTHYENGSYPFIELNEAVPHYITLPGWSRPINNIRKFENLPSQAKEYLKTIEELLETPISHISLGKERNQIIKI
ncbi:MAG: adenylosuccinate synthase [Candidatus Neomarinimicrobiota bacterium]|mgnify:CR=1 FL=1|nr:MAG: adenylosuccinate synthase [Candidatus Neomarinimicrobiota bacterium]